jgi:hypothetical protein
MDVVESQIKELNSAIDVRFGRNWVGFTYSNLARLVKSIRDAQPKKEDDEEPGIVLTTEINKRR